MNFVEKPCQSVGLFFYLDMRNAYATFAVPQVAVKTLQKMGRELKRVPIDFNWPIGQIWKGYISPYKSQECKSCEGTGLNKETKKLSEDWFSFDNVNYVHIGNGKRYNDNAWQYHLTEVEVFELLKRGRISSLTNIDAVFDEEENSWMKWENGKRVKCDAPEIPSVESVNEWAKVGPGHDAINKWICVKARAKHLGVYGDCECCDGHGDYYPTEEFRKLADSWENIEPPTGEGYQMWETTTEGSPKTPVFSTLEDLCEYCEKNCCVFAGKKSTKQEWFSMLSDGNVFYKEGNMVFV